MQVFTFGRLLVPSNTLRGLGNLSLPGRAHGSRKKVSTDSVDGGLGRLVEPSPNDAAAVDTGGSGLWASSVRGTTLTWTWL